MTAFEIDRGLVGQRDDEAGFREVGRRRPAADVEHAGLAGGGEQGEEDVPAPSPPASVADTETGRSAGLPGGRRPRAGRSPCPGVDPLRQARSTGRAGQRLGAGAAASRTPPPLRAAAP